LSQLQSLLQTLSNTEKEKLNSLRLIGKEKNVFDFIQKYTYTPLPEINQITEALKISDAHYYKINSILLRKSYQTLVPGENSDLLQFLKRKNLFSLLRHEILFQDKKTSSKKSHAELEKFYLTCFHYLIDLPYKYYDKKLTILFGNKYLSIKGHPESDALYIKFHLLFSDLNRIAAQKNPKKSIAISISQLLNYEKELQNSKHYLATYYLYRSICSYYSYYDNQPQKVIEYIEKTFTLKKHIADFFPIDINIFLQLLYADALFTNNRLEEAEKIYNKVFESDVDENMYGYFYHCEQYALVSITLKKYDQAKTMLDKVFQPCIDNRLDIYATRGALCYVKLFLSNGELKNALSYLNIAKMINEKTFYLPFDVQLRVLENFYFFLKKDYEFAYQLAVRNIKFLKAQDQSDMFENYLILWKLIIGMINSINKNNPINKELQRDYEMLKNNFVNLYCGLVEKVYLSVFP
jgi:hypothetical protein